MNDKKSSTPVVVPVEVLEGLSLNCLVSLSLDLMKALLFQRQQIPMTVETLRKETESSNKGEAEPDGVVVANGETSPSSSSSDGLHAVRAVVRKHRREVKRSRLRERFLKRADVFLKNYDDIAKSLADYFSAGAGCRGVGSICFLFGASFSSPKEVYQIVLPKEDSHSPSSGGQERNQSRKLKLSLFRTVLSTDALRDPLNLTNLHVALGRDCGGEATGSFDAAIMRSEFSPGKLPSRCRHTVVRLHRARTAPVPMELCTPLPDRCVENASAVAATPRSEKCCNVNMVETPCGGGVKQADRETSDMEWFFLKRTLKGFRDPQSSSF